VLALVCCPVPATRVPVGVAAVLRAPTQPDGQRLLSQPAEIMTVEGVVDGDDGVLIPGAVLLAASVAGTATGEDPG
jgi:hypothetical protein